MKIKISEKHKEVYSKIKLTDDDLIEHFQKKKLPDFFEDHSNKTWEDVFETFEDFHLYLKRIQMKREQNYD